MNLEDSFKWHYSLYKQSLWEYIRPKMKPLVKQVILWPCNLKVELLKPLISSLFLTQDFRVRSGSSRWSIIIWLNTVISRSANVIISFYQAAEHCRLLLTWGVELHCDGLKIVASVNKYIAFNIWTVWWEIQLELAPVWQLQTSPCQNQQHVYH